MNSEKFRTGSARTYYISEELRIGSAYDRFIITSFCVAIYNRSVATINYSLFTLHFSLSSAINFALCTLNFALIQRVRVKPARHFAF